jgi:O-succinylbenzoic acid--CoA ligase
MFRVVDDWVTKAARARPEHPAVAAAEGALTYAELDREADLAASRLTALGVGTGARVATTLPPSLDFAVLLHALPRIGAALVPLNTRLPAEQQARQRELARAELVADRLPTGRADAATRAPDLDPAAVHTVLFTSGTSGEPRPVELTLANHDASAAGSTAALGTEPADRWLCPLPLFHVGGLAILLRCARAGTTAVLHARFDAQHVAADLAGGSITLASLVPTMLVRLRDAGLERASGLRALLLGGGPIPPELLAWAREHELPVRATYGMTETGSQVVVTEPGEASGRSVTGAELTIAPAGGEILVRGPMVASGALADDGWLHTGDHGCLDERGHLHVGGRIKELIVTGGENVAPARVEATLLEHPAVRDAGVVGVEDPEWGEAVVALVVLERDAPARDLRDWCRTRLAGHEVPKRVEVVAQLPRNAAGKLVRRDLTALAG